MAQIRMSIDVLDNNVRKLRENVEIIRCSICEIKRINDELKQSWIDDKNKFCQDKLDNCEEMSMNELTELCEQFSYYLEKVAVTYRYTEQQLLNTLFGE